jgi:hypothetical protein
MFRNSCVENVNIDRAPAVCYNLNSQKKQDIQNVDFWSCARIGPTHFRSLFCIRDTLPDLVVEVRRSVV